MRKMLIVYYSWSNGNTKRIAEQLQTATGARTSCGLKRCSPTTKAPAACRSASFAQEREFRFDSTGGPKLVTPQPTIVFTGLWAWILPKKQML